MSDQDGKPPLNAAPPPAWPPAAGQTPPLPAPRPSWDQPTQAYTFEPGALDQPPLDPALPGPTPLLGGQPVGLPDLRDEGLRTAPTEQGGLDSLFGEAQFREYEGGALPVQGVGALATTRPRAERVPLGRTQRILLMVSGGLAAALLLVGVFALGMANPGLIPQAEPEPVVTAEPEPVAAAPAVGPLAAGTHDWDELLGTECIDPWVSPWAETFTVVDCTQPHAAQLVSRGILGDEAFAEYPGEEALLARMNLLCTAPTSIDYAVAAALDDVQVSSSFPVTEEQWTAGERSYSCFVTRSSKEPLTVSLAPAPVADAGPVPAIPGNAP